MRESTSDEKPSVLDRSGFPNGVVRQEGTSRLKVTDHYTLYDSIAVVNGLRATSCRAKTREGTGLTQLATLSRSPRISVDVLRAARRRRWIGIAIPEADGGGGVGITHTSALLEHVAASGIGLRIRRRALLERGPSDALTRTAKCGSQLLGRAGAGGYQILLRLCSTNSERR